MIANMHNMQVNMQYTISALGQCEFVISNQSYHPPSVKVRSAYRFKQEKPFLDHSAEHKGLSLVSQLSGETIAEGLSGQNNRL
jgi:hypothetical protein